MPQLPLRIAILECGVPPPSAASKYGGYGGIFKALLAPGADAISHPGLSSTSGLEISIWDVVNAQSYPSFDSIDAILMTGSKFNAFDNDPWILKLVEYVKEILGQRRVRIIGVCFGHQIVGRAMGVPVGRSDMGWETSVTAVDLTKRGQEIFGKSALALHQMHQDVVFEYPEGVEELAHTAKCKNHGMYISKRLITVQGHPEFDGEIEKEILATRHKLGIFDDATYEEAVSRADKYHDGVVIAAVFLKFLLEE